MNARIDRGLAAVTCDDYEVLLRIVGSCIGLQLLPDMADRKEESV